MMRKLATLAIALLLVAIVCLVAFLPWELSAEGQSAYPLRDPGTQLQAVNP